MPIMLSKTPIAIAMSARIIKKISGLRKSNRVASENLSQNGRRDGLHNYLAPRQIHQNYKHAHCGGF